MFMDIKQLRELFESTGNNLRFNWGEDYQKLSHYLVTGKVKAEQVNLTADPRGIFAKLLDFFASQRTWDEIAVARAIPALRSITNYGGQQHGALCLSAAAWLIDQGYEVLTEVWLNGRRVDLVTKCQTWLIECGETSPQPIVAHLNRGITKIAIIPFQAKEMSSIEAIVFTRSTSWSSDFVQQESIVDLVNIAPRASAGSQAPSIEQNTETSCLPELKLSSVDSLQNLFIDYTNHKSPRTVLAQRSDLELLSRFLYEHSTPHSHDADALQSDPSILGTVTT